MNGQYVGARPRSSPSASSTSSRGRDRRSPISPTSCAGPRRWCTRSFLDAGGVRAALRLPVRAGRDRGRGLEARDHERARTARRCWERRAPLSRTRTRGGRDDEATRFAGPPRTSRQPKVTFLPPRVALTGRTVLLACSRAPSCLVATRRSRASTPRSRAWGSRILVPGIRRRRCLASMRRLVLTDARHPAASRAGSAGAGSRMSRSRG